LKTPIKINLKTEEKTMTTIRWNTAPYAAELLSNLLENNLSNASRNCESCPAYNLLESENGWEIQMAIPGITKEETNIELKNKLLTIAFEKKSESNPTEKFLRKEFGISPFRKSFQIPKEADEEKIEAKYNNGILLISIPKREQEKANLLRNISIN